MEDEFNAKYQVYQQKASTWTPAIRESKEKELTEIQQRIQEFAQSIQTELGEQQQKLTAPVYKKAQDCVTELAKKGGYTVVLDKPSVLYIDEAQSVDLTPAARKVLGIPEGRTSRPSRLSSRLRPRLQQLQNKSEIHRDATQSN